MTKKQILIISALTIFVIFIILFGFLKSRGFVPNYLNPFSSTDEELEKMITGESNKLYVPQTPKNAELSSPKLEAPASTNKDSDAKALFFDLKATKNGFDPARITVNKGDNLQVDFTSVDSDYDLDIPYLGAYFSVVKKGVTKRLPFDTSLAGTFIFECRDNCPLSGKIRGELVVLP